MERGGKRRARLGRDAKNTFFLSRLTRPTGDSLRGRRSKGKGKGIRARDHARGRRFPSLLPRAPRVSLATKTPLPKTPFPFPFKRLPRRLYGRVRLARFARIRLLHHALPISLLILRKKPTVFAVYDITNDSTNCLRTWLCEVAPFPANRQCCIRG